MSLDADIAALSAAPVFDGLSDDALRLVAFGAEHRRFRAGDIVFREAALADAGFVVCSGTISLSRGRTDPKTGREPRVVARYGPATLIGEMALITDTRRPATARAETDADLLRVSRTLFRRLLEEYPAFAACIETRLRARLVAMTQEIAGMEHRFR